MPTPYTTTVTGSYPRPVQPCDTLKKPELSREEADEMIRWAVRDQVEAGLDIITDGECRRENMYYFFQKRMDGLSFKDMEYRTYGTAGFGIEIAAVVDKIGNPRVELAHDWTVAREAAPPNVEVKITCTGPHMLAKFSNNKRPDLYPTDRDLAFAYADVLNQELRELVAAGCQSVQFDDPAWTAFPEEAEWAESGGRGIAHQNRLTCLWWQSTAEAGLLYKVPRSGEGFHHCQSRSGFPGVLHAELQHVDALGQVEVQRGVRGRRD